MERDNSVSADGNANAAIVEQLIERLSQDTWARELAVTDIQFDRIVSGDSDNHQRILERLKNAENGTVNCVGEMRIECEHE